MIVACLVIMLVSFILKKFRKIDFLKTSPPSHLSSFSHVSLEVKKWIGEELLSWNSSLYETMKKRSDDKRRIYLGLVDASYTDMAYNMYVTSFKRFNITNFLYICSDQEAVHDLQTKHIFCYHYEQNLINSDVPGEAGYQDFIIKTATKMKSIYLALLYGFNVLVVDIDIVFLKNPINYLPTDKADVAFQQDIPGYGLNVGFGIVYASNASIKLFEEVCRLRIGNKIDDQKAVNRVLESMRLKKEIHVKILDTKQFPVGEFYYLNGKREFLGDNPCDECIIVHSSGIRTKVAKIYRFKEGGIWKANDETYFNKPEQKYLIYENTNGYTGSQVIDSEEKALKTAFKIGSILNRVVILPKMNCNKNFKCTILHRYRIEALDDFLQDKYREHVFLLNELVPTHIKKSLSPNIYLTSRNVTKNQVTDNAYVLKSDTLASGYLEAATITNWFDKAPWSNYSILRFSSLYFDVVGIEFNIDQSIRKGICRSDYIQIKRCPRS